MASKAVAAELSKTEKLNGNNFLTWKRRIRHILLQDGIDHALDKAVASPPEGAEESVKVANDKLVLEDKKARSIMLTFMEPDVEILFEDQLTAHAMFKAVGATYGETSQGHVKMLVAQYNGMKMQESDNIVEQINAMTVVSKELASLGRPIPEELQVETIINILPPSWDSTVVSLNMSDVALTVQTLTAKLTIEAQRRKKKSTTDSMVNIASGAGAPTSKPRNVPQKKQDFKKQGKKPQFKGNNSGKKIGPCYNCGKMGHIKAHCRANGKGGGRFQNKDNRNNNDIVCVVSEVLLVDVVENTWWLHSAASRHVAKSREFFSDFKEMKTGEHRVYMGNNTYCDVISIGIVRLKLPSGNYLVLTEVLCAPNIRRNLISIPCLDKKGLETRFKSGKATVGRNNSILFSGTLMDGLYSLDLYSRSTSNVKVDFEYACLSLDDSLLWHLRLGHVNVNKLHRMVSSGLLPKLHNELRTCENCLSSKMARLPFGKGERVQNLLEVIHSDICGPLNVKTHRGMSYFITFIDDYSRYGYIYLISKKSEALDKFKEFKVEVENQLGRTIKILKSDRGGEYTSDLFDEFCKANGICHQFTLPYTPQQNGVAERRNRTLLEMVRCMLNHSMLGTQFWGEALDTATYILNRVLCKTTKTTPYELWTGRSLDLSHLRVWGSGAHVNVPYQNRGKLDPKTIKCNFIGYSSHSKGGYRFVVHHSNGSVGVIESRDAYFLEENLDPRNPIKKDFYVMTSDVSDPNEEVLLDDPQTYEQALESKDSTAWLKAIQEELNSMDKNKVWELVELPEGRQPKGCKWIFKKKLKPDGTIDRYKARLVAKGFTQKEGIDYKETYSPVSAFTSIRVLLAIVAYLDLELHQMDVKTAFLNGDLEEEIYMHQPERLAVKDQGDKVCRLAKAIYGLKQSPRQWFFTFHKVITEYGFIPNLYDPCVYTQVSGGKFVILCLYVDDILFMGNDLEMVLRIKEWLKTLFDMKDIGEASFILGIKIERDRKVKKLSLSQERYLDSVLKRFGVVGWKTIDSPIYKGTSLSKEMAPSSDEERLKMQSIPYAQVVGSLMYAMLCTRPDLGFVVSLVSRYQSDPGALHWQVVKRILRYLLGTKDYKLTYQTDELIPIRYTDSDYAGDPDDRKSTSGFVFMLGGAAISWASKKQKCVARSTMEAEFVASSLASTEAVWIKGFLEDLKLSCWDGSPIQLFCDNQATVTTLKNGEISSKGKHIEVHYHYVFDILQKGKVVVSHIPTSEMLADPLTKVLTTDCFLGHVYSMGLRRD
ncbi:hypothetical protein H6P81_002815 [Aristolochia fimbriata]|uniref:Gag-pol polyprotein n=1 Tax=Aristolochia fimbriata TaxID=158543 RepID=A0AAV7FE18_ARIFI|nr:hypothetical protein H6P81_002815 [Aristolochia fimbriata]